MLKIKLLIFLIVLFIIQIIFPFKVYAESSYVLPYPSYMPGSFYYKTHLILEKLEKYWYLGNFSQFSYNLKLSDKYLVEAKTLFEYKQYLLAHVAVKKSDDYFDKASLFLDKAREEGKNIAQKEKIFKEASYKHIEILEKIKQSVPESFVWTPEKEKETILFLWMQIDTSIDIRERYL